MPASNQLHAMLQGSPRFAAVAALCDEFDLPTRVAAVRGIGAAEQAKLFKLAAEAPPATLDFILPRDLPSTHQVIWRGRNAAPAFWRMGKSFSWSPDGQELWGWNTDNPWGALIGPGYFVCTLAPTQRPGELMVDYRRHPSAPLSNWPPLVPSSARLGRLIYAGMVDYLRPVGRNVLIGCMFDPNKGEPLSPMHYFCAARGDAEPRHI